MACIESDVGLSGNQRVVEEAIVFQRVVDDERGASKNGVTAERDVARRLLGVEPDGRFEPLSILVDQRHERRLDAEQPSGQAGDPVKFFFGRGVQDAQVEKLGQARFFIGRTFRRIHDSSPVLGVLDEGAHSILGMAGRLGHEIQAVWFKQRKAAIQAVRSYRNPLFSSTIFARVRACRRVMRKRDRDG